MKPTPKPNLNALSLLALSSGAAFAGHHWGNNDGMWQQGGNPLTTEQQATAQK
ncbi:zinc resistance sensor/chaperone ZraP, partial [Salmonella enterica subsp. enterica serovar Anatum]|nr:zinc resistance sensor/chaperone ZraP [Salmonella enterica subsp. enterica serovar Anatum]